MMFTFIVVYLSFSSCKKENAIESDELSNRKEILSLSNSSFRDLYNNIKKLKIKPKIISDFNSLEDFVLERKEKNLEDEIGKQIINSKPALREFSTNSLNSTNHYSVDSTTLYSAIINELVEDNPLKNLINKRREIIVNGVFYKVTPFGVLYVIENKRDLLIKVYEDLLSRNDILVRIENPSKKINFSGVNVNIQSNNIDRNTSSNELIKVNMYQDMYEVNFIDTFIEVDGMSRSYIDGGLYGGGGGNNSTLNNDPYSDIIDIPVEYQKTIAGGILRTLFVNMTEYRYFNDDFRMSVLLYNRNYGLLKTLGIKVKLQEKGWFWWNKKDAQEIRAGWERIVYEQANAIPKITRPANTPAINLGNSYISPYEAPLNGWFTSNYSTLYKWNFAKVNQELFSIVVPYYLLPNDGDNLVLPSSKFKPLIPTIWKQLETRLKGSVPMSASNDKENYKFPVYDISNGSISYLSINDIRKLPLSVNEEPNRYNNAILGGKYRTYLTPYEEHVINNESIEIPLDFSTATISLNANLNSPLSVSRALDGLGVSGLDDSYEVNEADVIGLVKYNGKWLGIRLIVK